MRVAFCVSGHGSLFRAAVSRAAEVGIEPVLLVMETKAAPDLDRLGVPAVRVEKIAQLGPALDDAQPDLVVLTFDRIVPGDVVARHRMVNVHPALLPSFAGMRGMERTLESGAAFGGATMHEVIEEVDAGPIVAQCVVGTIPGEPLEDYGRRVYALLEPMYLQVLRWYAEGRVGRDGKVRDARYGALPINPAPERFAP